VNPAHWRLYAQHSSLTDNIRFMSAVLLLAYRRWQNIEPILDECRVASVSRIYIHIDGGTSVDEKKDVARTLEQAVAYKRKWGTDIRVATQKENVGCAVSMILSLHTIFRVEDHLIVLEDDCIPTQEFFKFITDSFKQIERNSEVGISCGAQFASSEITRGTWLLSRYPLNWGWGISNSQWALLSSKMVSEIKLDFKSTALSKEEVTYWNAGSRRALAGYTDVWDTLIVREMIRHNLYSILPGNNLVSNVGNDVHALHTHGEQLWTNYPTGIYNRNQLSPIFNSDFDSWARTQFFKISKRHLISTKVTWLRDLILTKPKRKPLSERIQLAEVNFDL
jgi:hypothetical protein